MKGLMVIVTLLPPGATAPSLAAAGIETCLDSYSVGGSGAEEN